MGSLRVPTSGLICVDTMCVIYSVERSTALAALLEPLWDAAKAGTQRLGGSELLLMECPVLPYHRGDAALVRDFEAVLLGWDFERLPVSAAVLDRAARLRAAHSGLRTPDAIHVATAQIYGADYIVTNDRRLKSVPGLAVELLADVLNRP